MLNELHTMQAVVNWADVDENSPPEPLPPGLKLQMNQQFSPKDAARNLKYAAFSNRSKSVMDSQKVLDAARQFERGTGIPDINVFLKEKLRAK